MFSHADGMIDAEVSKTDGRVGKTTNVIIGGTVADDSAQDWLELDQKVFSFYFYCQLSTRVSPFKHYVVV